MRICEETKPFTRIPAIEGHIYKHVIGITAGDLYLCGSAGPGLIILINLKDGTRWTNPSNNPFGGAIDQFIDVTDEYCLTRK